MQAEREPTETKELVKPVILVVSLNRFGKSTIMNLSASDPALASINTIFTDKNEPPTLKYFEQRNTSLLKCRGFNLLDEKITKKCIRTV